MLKTYLLILLIFLSFTAFSQPTTFNVLDFGASGNKSDKVTHAIQAAIDSCYFTGGGTVYFPPGDYLTGTIVLKDNVGLHVEAGATLFASHEINDYRIPLDYAITPVLIYANGAKNISIRGKGMINGEAKRNYEDLKRVDKFVKDITENARQAGVEMKMYYKVPPITGLVLLTNCVNITLEDITLYESTYWTLHLIKSERIFIRGLHIFSSLESGVNADGIDIDCCKNVTVSDCIITTGDDAICLKTTFKQPCENVTVTNCVLSSSSTALKLGTETVGDFRNISFSNCVITNSNRGLGIIVRDGAHVSDVLFSNITISCNRRHFNWWGNGDPIHIFITKRRGVSPVGIIENVVFENIIAHARGTSRLESLYGKGIRNITFRDVKLIMEPEDYKDKRADHAFAAFDIEDLLLDGLEVDWNEKETEEKWENAIYLQKVDGLEIRDFRGRQGLPDSKYPVILLENVTDAFIHRSEAKPGASTLVEVRGDESRNITLKDNNSLGHSPQTLKKTKNSHSIIDLDQK